MRKLHNVIFALLAGLALAIPLSIAFSSVLFFSLLGFWVLGGFWTFRRWPPPWGRIEKAFLVFLAISFVSSLFGSDPLRSSTKMEKDLYFSLYILLGALLAHDIDTKRLLYVFVGAGVFSALWGVIQYGVGVNQTDCSGGTFIHLPPLLAHWPRAVLDQLSMVNGRPTGTRCHPLTYSEGLLFVFAFGLSFLATSQRWPGAWLGVSWIVGIALVLSQSRGPWLGAIAMMGMTLLIRKSWKVVSRLLVLLAPLACLCLVPLLRERVQSILNPNYFSNQERLHMWRAGWQIIKRHPFLGVGPGNVKYFTPLYQNEKERREGPWTHLHNTFINVAAERGFLGLFAFLGLMVTFAFELIQVYVRAARDSPQQALVGGALLGLIGFLIAGFTEAVYNDTVVLMTFYFVMGTALRS